MTAQEVLDACNKVKAELRAVSPTDRSELAYYARCRPHSSRALLKPYKMSYQKRGSSSLMERENNCMLNSRAESCLHASL